MDSLVELPSGFSPVPPPPLSPPIKRKDAGGYRAAHCSQAIIPTRCPVNLFLQDQLPVDARGRLAPGRRETGEFARPFQIPASKIKKG